MITVPPEARDKRLDHFLTETDTSRTRSQWQKIIKAGLVLLDGKTVAVHHFLKGGETISISEPKVAKVKTPKLEVIAETSDYLVVAKPAGILVHPTDGSHEPTLVDSVLAYDKKIKKVGEEGRPGIVHRLDKLVSGVMVIARTQKMYEHLKQEFKDRNIEKEYVALVHGPLPHDIGEITFPIGRSRDGGRMAARAEGSEGREAKTRYEVIERLPNMTLVSAFPETGRTHQIRAHFHAMGHSIVGDPLYRTRDERKRPAVVTEQIMLHAKKISFTDLAGETKTFELKPPKVFSDFVKSQK